MMTVRWLLRGRWLACAGLFAALHVPATGAPTHPMDALTAAEIDRTVAILRAAKMVSESTRYPTISLQENSKASVLKWNAGEPFERHARATYYEKGRLFEARVDLTAGAVKNVAEISNRQATVLLEEFLGASEIVKKDRRWQAAMRKRGYTRYDQIICSPLTVGPVIDPRFSAMRLLNVPCFDRTGAANNIYGRPIENVLATVDVVAGKVLEVIDLGVVPVPALVPSHVYDPATATRARGKPVNILSPKGDNFTLEGGIVSWDKWRFHLRVDKRLGPVISQVAYREADDSRQIAYQINASEMFVPYMDTAPTWAYRGYMDIGEYGFGALASPLKLGSDCPVNARLLDATISDDRGRPLTLKNVVCIFERDTGDPLWRHYEVFTESHESRPNVELVARMAPEVGNYDYLLDFVFNRRGEIEVRVGAYGIDAVKAVALKTMTDKAAKIATASGTLIAPNLIGVNHDHYMSFRIDLDVDGPSNRVVVDRFVQRQVTDSRLRNSIWQVESTIEAQERLFEPTHESSWTRIESQGRRNALGNSTSYHLVPGHSDTSLLSASEPLQQRAAFTSAPLWVTRYHPEELFASGTYPNQNPLVEGLPVFIKNAEPIGNQDIVLWYTLGFRHQTRSEDWPVMPGIWHGFKLRPFNFFDRNPGLDVPNVPDDPRP